MVPGPRPRRPQIDMGDGPHGVRLGAAPARLPRRSPVPHAAVHTARRPARRAVVSARSSHWQLTANLNPGGAPGPGGSIRGLRVSGLGSESPSLAPGPPTTGDSDSDVALRPATGKPGPRGATGRGNFKVEPG